MDFIKVGAACPKTKVSDIKYNVENICFCIDDAYAKGVKFLVFPELCITSYTCGDLFLTSALLNKTLDGLKKNKNITLLTVEKLCNIIDCTPNDIVEFK